MYRQTRDQPDAIAEGRRIYLGNLSYDVHTAELEEFLEKNGYGNEIDAIHISIDPVSRRNPGYCFVDFVTRETAETALSSLSGSIHDRQLKVGPGRPKEPRQRGWGERNAESGGSTYQKWGNWEGDNKGGASFDTRPDRQAQGTRQGQGPRGVIDHEDNTTDQGEGLRIYVGGLGQMADQAQNDAELRNLFGAFNPVAIGKRITPHEKTRDLPGHHHYCFIDFENRQDAADAIQALNGAEYDGEKLRVSWSKRIPPKVQGRTSDTGNIWRRSNNPTGGSRPSATPRALGAGSWRRGPDNDQTG